MQIYVTSVCEKGILKQTLHFLNVCDFPSFSASRGYSREFNKQIRSFGTIKSIHLCLISIKTYSSSSILGKKANKQPYFLNFFLGEGMPLPPKKFEKKRFFETIIVMLPTIFEGPCCPNLYGKDLRPPPLYVMVPPLLVWPLCPLMARDAVEGGGGLPSARGGGQGSSVKQ